MTDWWSALEAVIATALGVLPFVFVPMVLLRKKEPAATFAWILVILFVPVLGIVMFWYLGRDRVRRPVRHRVAVSAPLREKLDDRVSGADALGDVTFEKLLGDQPEEQRGVMRLATHIAGADIRAGNDVRVIVGAQPAYDALVEAIAAAEHHVHLEYYIFRGDRSGRAILDALTDAARRGVEVRLLYDGFGSAGLGRHLRALRKAGAEASVFFPLDPIRRASTINLRNHRKLVVVDGCVAFVGGINVGEEFLPWRDVNLRIEGPVCAQVQRLFAADWYFSSRRELVGEDYFPALDVRGDSLAQIVESGPDHTVEAIHRLYFAAIASARRRVWITTPYFVPDRAILAALQTAALRGVDVRLVVPRHSNHRVTFHAGRSFYDELLAAGVRIHEYLDGMLHTKTMVVDGRFGTVGSANLDVRSFRLNFELIAVLYGEGDVAELERIFREDLERTELVHLDSWRERPLSTRVKEGFGRLMSPLL